MALPIQVPITIEPVCCCECGSWFGMDSVARRRAVENPEIYFCCPSGHRQHYTDTEVTRLRREVEQKERARQNALYLKELAERSARSLRGQLTKVRKRISNGVCPCCSRTFENLQRHMKAKHPKYKQLEGVKR